VDAPPFDSLEDLSGALARYERSDRSEAIDRLLRRAADAGTVMATPLAADRRRGAADVAELRRQLRDADARVYDQQRAIDALGGMAGPVPQGSKRIAIAAGLAAGLVMIGAGDSMRHRDATAFVVVPPPPPAQMAADLTPVPDPPNPIVEPAKAVRAAS